MEGLDLIGWLGREAGVKAAESFLLPPRKVTPKSRTVRPTDGPVDFDQEGGRSQLPNAYGQKRKKDA